MGFVPPRVYGASILTTWFPNDPVNHPHDSSDEQVALPPAPDEEEEYAVTRLVAVFQVCCLYLLTAKTCGEVVRNGACCCAYHREKSKQHHEQRDLRHVLFPCLDLGSTSWAPGPGRTFRATWALL